MVSKSAASDTMSALVRKQLVTKSRDLEDGRIMRLDLTDRGRELLAIDPLNNLVTALRQLPKEQQNGAADLAGAIARNVFAGLTDTGSTGTRSEEQTSELQSIMRIAYAVFC